MPFHHLSHKSASREASTAAANSAGPIGQSAQRASGDKAGLIPRGDRFLDLEPPVELLSEWITPVERFYVRNHLFEPEELDAAEWRLTIGGEVEKPLRLTLADVEGLPVHSVTNVLECAGNGRSMLTPKIAGTAWNRGAVGNATFSGAALRAVLERAGVKETARHVEFRGLDWSDDDAPAFVRSIPIEKALDPDTLIATHMNGEPLSMHHGFPARALVPGWVGAASCKWLTEINVLTEPSREYFMSLDYRLPNTPGKPGEPIDLADTEPLTQLTVKSLITSPAEVASLPCGPHAIEGFAWAGEAEVVQVEVSIDGGATWNVAQLGEEHARYAWRRWSYRWNATQSGEYSIVSRAADSRGRVQPEMPVWNPGGYMNNASDRVTVRVQG